MEKSGRGYEMTRTIINYFCCSLEPMRFGVNSAFSRLFDEMEDSGEDSGEMSPHYFTAHLVDKQIHFQSLKMSDSLFLWIGETPTMDNMAVASPTKFSSVPACTVLMGEDSSSLSSAMTQRLSKRTGKQIFLSYNLPPDEMLSRAVEKRIIDEMKASPDLF